MIFSQPHEPPQKNLKRTSRTSTEQSVCWEGGGGEVRCKIEKNKTQNKNAIGSKDKGSRY